MNGISNTSSDHHMSHSRDFTNCLLITRSSLDYKAPAPSPFFFSSHVYFLLPKILEPAVDDLCLCPFSKTSTQVSMCGKCALQMTNTKRT